MKQLIDVALSVGLVERLGLRFGLVHGGLGRYLELTPRQKEEIDANAKEAAELLWKRSHELNRDLLEHLDDVLDMKPEDYVQLKKIVDAQYDWRCPYPEGIIPQEAYNRYNLINHAANHPLCPLHLRRLYKVPEKEN